MTATDEKYTELRKQEKELESDLESIKQEIRVLMAQIRFEQFHIRIGSIVKVHDVLYRVSSFETGTWRNPYEKSWVRGNPQRKDGTYGTADRYLYGDWEIVTP